MSTFVLIHGGFHWGGCWEAVQTILEQNGYRTYAPDLPLEPDTTLADHFQQIVELIHRKRLHNVVLVGHSYGGMVISGVAAMIPEKISHIVYLDAVIPTKGGSLMGLLPNFIVQWIIKIYTSDSMLKIPANAHGFGIEDPKKATWVEAHLRPHSAKTMLDPFPFDISFDSSMCTYIACRHSLWNIKRPLKKPLFLNRINQVGVDIMAKKAKNLGWNYVEINSGHDVMVIDPEKLADIFLALV